MSSLPDALHAGSYYVEQTTADVIITAYLDTLYRALIGVIPAQECIRLREAAGFHLDRLLNDYIVEGMVPPLAARHAKWLLPPRVFGEFDFPNTAEYGNTGQKPDFRL